MKRALIAGVVGPDLRVLDAPVRIEANHAAARGVHVHGLAARVGDADEVGRVLDERCEHRALLGEPLRALGGSAHALVEHAVRDGGGEEDDALDVAADLDAERMQRRQQPQRGGDGDRGGGDGAAEAADPRAEEHRRKEQEPQRRPEWDRPARHDVKHHDEVMIEKRVAHRVALLRMLRQRGIQNIGFVVQAHATCAFR